MGARGPPRPGLGETTEKGQSHSPMLTESERGVGERKLSFLQYHSASTLVVAVLNNVSTGKPYLY